MTTNSEDRKQLIESFISLLALRAIKFLIPLVTLPYLVRTIGIENFGLVNFALSLSLYFGAIIQFGFTVTATREVARNRHDKKKLSQIYSATLSLSMLLAAISTVLFVLIVASFEVFSAHLNLYAFTFTYVVFQSSLPIWLFQGMEKMRYVTYLSVISDVLFLFGLFVFVKQKQDYEVVPLLNTIAAVIVFFISLYLIKRQFKISFMAPKWREIKLIYTNGIHAFVSQLAPNLYNNSSTFFLGLFANSTVLGLYSASTKIIDALISLAHVLSGAFLPHLSRKLHRHVLFQKIMMISGFIVTVLTFFMADWIVYILLGEMYIEAAKFIQYLSVSIMSIFISLTYGKNYLMLVGRDKVVKDIALYTSIVFFIFAFISIAILGAWGAILTLIGARFTMALAQFIYYFKHKNNLCC